MKPSDKKAYMNYLIIASLVGVVGIILIMSFYDRIKSVIPTKHTIHAAQNYLSNSNGKGDEENGSKLLVTLDMCRAKCINELNQPGSHYDLKSLAGAGEKAMQEGNALLVQAINDKIDFNSTPAQ